MDAKKFRHGFHGLTRIISTTKFTKEHEEELAAKRRKKGNHECLHLSVTQAQVNTNDGGKSCLWHGQARISKSEILNNIELPK